MLEQDRVRQGFGSALFLLLWFYAWATDSTNESFPVYSSFRSQTQTLSFILLAPRLSLLWRPCGYQRGEAVSAWLSEGPGQGRDECSAEERKHGLLCNVISIIGKDLTHVIN